MKRKVFKSAVALLLALISVFSVCSVAFAATENYPVIYIWGRTGMYKDVDSDNPKLILYNNDAAMTSLVKRRCLTPPRRISAASGTLTTRKCTIC